MPVSWVVSAHAASYGKKSLKGSLHKLVQIPKGVRFYFFEDEKVPLAVNKAWTIYDLVMKRGATGQDYVAISQVPGYRMFDKPALPDYAITGDDSWIDKHGQLASGIFVFGDEFHRDLRTLYIRQGQWYSLSEFFADPTVTWNPGDQVYWLACRSWA
jgi:hypothetical protein